MRFVPTCGGFRAESEGNGESRAEANHVLNKPRAEERAPVHLGGSWIKEEAGNAALQERLHAGERRLAELTQRDGFVGLEALEPNAEIDLMSSAGEADTILKRVEIPRDGETAAIVAPSQAELRLRVGGGATANNDCSDGTAEKKSGDARCGSTGSGFAGKEVPGARKAKSRGVKE